MVGKLAEKIECIELHTKKISVIEGSAFTRGGTQNKVRKKPKVIFTHKKKVYNIKEHRHIWAILRQLDTDLTWKEYNAIINVPENILKEVLTDYFTRYDEAIVVWVQINADLTEPTYSVFDVSIMNIEWVKTNERALQETQGYLEWKLDRPLNTYYVAHNEGIIFRVNTHGADWNGLAGFIEIISKDAEIKIRGRYCVGDGFVQVIDPVIFKGTLGTIDVEKLYGHLDKVWGALNQFHLCQNQWQLKYMIESPLGEFAGDEHFATVKNTYNMKPKEQDSLERMWADEIMSNTFFK